MPIKNYECKNEHVTEKITGAGVALPETIKCECGSKASPTVSTRTGVQFGLGFSKERYACKSDRGAWLANRRQRDW